jgi:hypothetical protein
MTIPEYARANFNTLLRAAASGDLALLDCADAVTGEPRYFLCAIAGMALSTRSRRLATSRRAIPTRLTSRREPPRNPASECPAGE